MFLRLFAWHIVFLITYIHPMGFFSFNYSDYICLWVFSLRIFNVTHWKVWNYVHHCVICFLFVPLFFLLCFPFPAFYWYMWMDHFILNLFIAFLAAYFFKWEELDFMIVLVIWNKTKYLFLHRLYNVEQDLKYSSLDI